MTELHVAPQALSFDPLNGSNGLPLTMSSREIAELTEKRHDHVVRDIEKMLTDLGEGLPKFGDTYINPQNGQTYRSFRLPKNLTLNLIAGYRSDIRLRIINRWMELETAPIAGGHTVPRSYAEALLEAARLEGERAALAAENAILLPKADALDRIATADGSLNITQAAKALQMRPKDLFGWLSQHHWIYRRAGSDVWLGYQSHTMSGDVEHKVTTVSRPDGSEKITEQVRITARGVTKLAKLIPGRPEVVEGGQP